MQTSLELQREGQIKQGFSVVRVGVALLPHTHRPAQMLFGPSEASATQIPQARLRVATHVHRIAAKGLFVVVECRPGGVTVLLQMQAREIELVDAFALHRRQSGFGGVGNGAHVVGFGRP